MASDETSSSDRIHVEQLEVFARVGVTDNERAAPQRLTFNVTIWPTTQFEKTGDDITQTVNYSAVAVAVRDFAREQTFKLIETLAAGLAAHFLKTFPANKVDIEVRKFVLPEAQYVSVRLVRTAGSV